jgi:hypothetical protein
MVVPRGGARNGAGRPKGGLTKKTQEIIAKVACDGQITPLEYMMNILRDETADAAARTAMAIAAAPYVHPKLSAVQANVTLENHEKALSDLE